MGSLIRNLSEIYCSLQQWKNFANRSRIDKVIAMYRVAPFFWLTLYNVPAQETAKHYAKFGWPLVSDVAAVTKASRETRWNLLDCPKLPNRSHPLVCRRSPYKSYCEDMWKRYCRLTSFFPIVDACLRCEDTAWQNIVRWCPWRWLIFGDFCVQYFQRTRVQQISSLHSKFALRTSCVEVW